MKMTMTRMQVSIIQLIMLRLQLVASEFSLHLLFSISLSPLQHRRLSSCTCPPLQVQFEDVSALHPLNSLQWLAWKIQLLHTLVVLELLDVLKSASCCGASDDAGVL